MMTILTTTMMKTLTTMMMIRRRLVLFVVEGFNRQKRRCRLRTSGLMVMKIAAQGLHRRVFFLFFFFCSFSYPSLWVG